MANEWKPRLCVMTKGENGYGFHLHGEKGKSGQFIRKVETGSPAEASGMRAGDRVVAVNGANVEKETHHQVGRPVGMLEVLPLGCSGASTGHRWLCSLTRGSQSIQPAGNHNGPAGFTVLLRTLWSHAALYYKRATAIYALSSSNYPSLSL